MTVSEIRYRYILPERNNYGASDSDDDRLEAFNYPEEVPVAIDTKEIFNSAKYLSSGFVSSMFSIPDSDGEEENLSTLD